jgi:hypothetical protein
VEKTTYIIGALCSALLTEYQSDYPIEKYELGGECSTYGNGRGTYTVLVGRHEERRSLGRRHRCEDNIKMDIQDVGSRDMERIVLAQDRGRWRAPLSGVMNRL